MKRYQLVLISLILSITSCESKTVMHQVTHQDNLPSIKVFLGMDYREVVKQSSVPVTFSDPSTSSSGLTDFHNDIQHQLIYMHPIHGFVLPHMEQVFMYSKNGKVQQIADRPIVGLMTIDNALSWCKSHMEIIDKAGWSRDDSSFMHLYSGETMLSYKSFDEVRSVFLTKNPEIELKGIRVAAWRDGNHMIMLDLDRKRYYDNAPEDLSKEEKYLVTLTIAYDVLNKKSDN